jgi:hypothetical protein
MWILKISKDILEYIQSRALSFCNRMKAFIFSTIYTVIPHSKLKDRLKRINPAVFHKTDTNTLSLEGTNLIL